jgi:hypothetical protein
MLRGGLFTRYFLEDGIREADPYRALNPAEVLAFADTVRRRWRNLEDMRRPTEAETEAEFIFPLLDELGWHHLPQQEPGKGRRDVADALLFRSETEKNAARRLQAAERFKRGAVVVENEARDTLLDRASSSGETPALPIPHGAPKRARRRFGCSIACCSCSTPRIATCCRRGCRDTPITACAICARKPPRSRTNTRRCPPALPHGGHGCAPCSRQSPKVTRPWACPPTTAACSRMRPETYCCG